LKVVMDSAGKRPQDNPIGQPLREPKAEAKMRRGVEGMHSVRYQRHALAEGLQRIALASSPEYAAELLDEAIADIGADREQVLATALVGLLDATTPRMSSATMRAFGLLDGS
jgi:hypothetical protein